jgi:glutaredoxin 3
MKVTVYTTQTCPYCVMVKRWLDDKKVEYTEYQVDKNPIAAQSMVQLSGQRGVPFTTVEDDEGTLHPIAAQSMVQLSGQRGVPFTTVRR